MSGLLYINSVVVKIRASNQQSQLLGFLGTRPRTIKGRPAQTNRDEGPGRGRSKPLRRGDQTKAMTVNKRAQRRVVEYVQLVYLCLMGERPFYRRRFWWRWSLETGILSTLPRPKARKRQYFNSDQLMSILMVALASSVEMTWRGPMDSFYLGQEGSEISNLWRDQGRPVLASRLPNRPSQRRQELTPERPELPRGRPLLQERVVRPDRFLGEALGPQASMMASAATAEKNSGRGSIPGGQGEKWIRFPFDQVVTKFLHVVGQVFVFPSKMFSIHIWCGNSDSACSRGLSWGLLSPLRSRDFAEGALNQKAVAESAEMEMVRAQNRAIELEGALAEEKAKGRKLAEDVDARRQGHLEVRGEDFRSGKEPVPHTRQDSSPAFKESDDFLEALAKQYPDLGVDLEDVEMDQELLAKEEAEAEKRAAEEEAAETGIPNDISPRATRYIWRGRRLAMKIPCNGMGLLKSSGEISPRETLGECCSVFDSHLAANKSTVLFMSFNTNLGGEESEQSLPSWISDHLGAKSYIDETNQSTSSPPIPTNSSKMDTSSLNKESNIMSQAELDKLGTTYSFPQGVRLRIPGDGETILSARQGERCLYSLSPLPDSGWYYFKARPEKNLLRGSPSNVKGWKPRFFFASGDEWELAPGTAASESSLRVPRSWGTPAATSCRLCPRFDAKRMEAVFGKIEPGGYFEVSKVLNSRTFKRHFRGRLLGAFDQWRRQHDLGRRGWLGGKVKDPFSNLLSGTSGSSSDSGSDSIFGFRAAPELRSDAMSARGKAVAEKAKKATAAKHPTKGVVIREKRTREGDLVIEIGEEDSLKGKETVPPPPPKSSEVAYRGDSRHPTRKKFDQLSENDLVAKSFHALGQVVVYALLFALRSQEHLHDIDFHMARADSAELELVEGSKNGSSRRRLGWPSLTRKYQRPGTEVDDLKATCGGTYKRRLRIPPQHILATALSSARGSFFTKFPNLGADVANMAMDPSFAEGGRGDEGRRRSDV
ncbi:hypothetical protein Acr_05g0014250 [Actinidia rufa]|uniref:Uncharacterized protein n=1 Tax=Actinidia rufa TaxID=165716 RepID=A0A7J0ENP1_9ERIC|nr:hypothetical protein Acr_05g0014250 [Actinidia rufa]